MKLFRNYEGKWTLLLRSNRVTRALGQPARIGRDCTWIKVF